MSRRVKQGLTRREFLRALSATAIGMRLVGRGYFALAQTSPPVGVISDCTTYHYTPARTGWFTGSGASFPPVEGWRKYQEVELGSAVRGTPLVLEGWKIQGSDAPHAGETHDLLFVATSGNRVDAYAIDRLPAGSTLPLWSQQLPPALNKQGSNIPPPIGISSTPVLDPQNRRMFVLVCHDDGAGNGVFFIYSLSLDNGKILQQAKLYDAGAAGRPTFDGAEQDQRGALNLIAGRVYATFAGFSANDLGNYRGWVVGCNADNLADQWFFSDTVSANTLGGIWGPGGVAAASDGSLYVATGNGTRGSDDVAGDSAYWATLMNGASALEGNKMMLPARAVGAPALISMNNALLAVAWAAAEPPHQLKVTRSRDGRSFEAEVTLPENTIDGPGFAFGTADAYSNGLAFLTWTDASQHLNVIASGDGQTFGNKITLDATSPVGPALAFGNGRWYLAWVAADSFLLNIMSWTDVAHLADLTNVTLDESSGVAPGLSFIDGTLYLFWRGTDETLYIMQSADGVNFTDKVDLAESSDFRPALTQQSAFFYLAWTGRDPQHQLHLTIGNDVSSLGNKQAFAEASGAGPALANAGGQIYVGWTSADDPPQINISPGRHPADVGDYFQCVLRLGTSDGLKVLDWYSPVDIPYQNFQDWDLGGSSVLMLPPINGRELLVLTGKDGSIYLLDRLRLGGWGGELRRISVFDNSSAKLSKCAPAYFHSDAGVHYVYVASESFPGLVAYKVVVSADGKSADLQEAWIATVSGPNGSAMTGITPGIGMGSPVVMSTPGASHEAVVWIVDNVELEDGSEGIAVLRGLDALTGVEVFNSSKLDKDNTDNALGPAPHFPPITCCSAGVFVGIEAGFAWYGP